MNTQVEFNSNYGSLITGVSHQQKTVRQLSAPAPRVEIHQLIYMFFAVAAGALVAIALLAGVTVLPETQHLLGLAALAAGIALPMAMRSISDDSWVRGVFRATVAFLAGVIAYYSLSANWGLLAISWSFLFAWAVTDWIHRGVSFRLAGLLSGLLVLASYTLTQI